VTQAIRPSLLVVDDDSTFVEALRRHFDGRLYTVATAATAAAALKQCEEKAFDLVLLDQRLPDGEGGKLCPTILERNEHAQIVLITAEPTFETAVEALKAGAVDYLPKPIELAELEHVLSQCLRTVELERINDLHGYQSRRMAKETTGLPGLAEVMGVLDLAATSDSPVLITGETGSGKNVLAKYVHSHSDRRDGPYVVVNCAALPEGLIEGELFGHQRGAFTGAVESRRGLFELADRGSILLDEIGEMPLGMQAKLLQVLDEGKVRRLGAESDRKLDVRVLACSNLDLEQAIAARRFRSDLYFRLNVVRIRVPPLRAHRQDIPELVRRFIEELSPSRRRRLVPAALDRLAHYPWPGNLRELRNVVERALLLQPGPEIDPSVLLDFPNEGETPIPRPTGSGGGRALEDVEREHILDTWRRNGQNATRAAKALGISLSTLKRRLSTYGVRADQSLDGSI
jgi:DNA-binding NtrC family response regulator